MRKWHTLEQIFGNFVGDYPSDLAAWKMMIKSSEAIIGEKSNMPIRGINCRIGARIGSVMSCVIV
jgi:hypothetical protein